MDSVVRLAQKQSRGGGKQEHQDQGHQSRGSSAAGSMGGMVVGRILREHNMRHVFGIASGKAAVVNVVMDNMVVNPRFESLSFRLGVIAHQPDVSRVPEPFRSYLLHRRTPEVGRELERLGAPRGKTRQDKEEGAT